MNKTTGRELYNLYHDPETKKKAQEIALQQAEPIIQRMIYTRGQTACNRDDMAQECRIAVLSNLDGYDPDKGAFSTYIADYIFNTAYATGYKNVYGVSPYTKKRYGVDFTIDLQSKDQDGQSMDDCREYMDSGYNTEDEALLNIERAVNAERLYKALEALPERQKQALSAIYGLYGKNPMKTSEYAAKQGISRDTVNRLHSSAIKALQKTYNVTDQHQTLDRTGQKGHDRAGHPYIIIRYDGCNNIDAIVRDHNTYYMLLSANYYTLNNRDLLYKGCKVNRQQINPETEINGRRAAAYF